MSRDANPTRFVPLRGAVFPWSIMLAAAMTAAGPWFGLVGSPADHRQGGTDVPSARMGLSICANIAAASATAPVGAGFGHVLRFLYCGLGFRVNAPVHG